MDSIRFKPQSLSTAELNENEKFTVTGFRGNDEIHLKTKEVSMSYPNSGKCDSMFPQAYCTEDRNILDELCGGFLGAAVFDTSQNSIRGIAIYDSFCSVSDEFRVYFHSVSDFRDWVLQVSAADKSSLATLMTLLSYVIVNLMK
jgi:hypothetical protein